MKLTKTEQQLFQNLHIERQLDAKTFNKPAYQGIWSGIVDKYKEKAHFVYELLQNADDAQASEAIFILEEDRLLFRHNGVIGFSISKEDDVKNKGHINAITGVGNSTKNETDGNTIGKFGVGFKAVFQYTKEPHIYDDKFWFKIENYIVPTALDEDFIDRKDGETVFVFPFFDPEDAYDQITDRLSNLDNPILFLRNLKKVIIQTPEDGQIVYSKDITEISNKKGIKHELVVMTNYGKKSRMHMFTQQVDITSDGKIYKQYISVGYLIDSKGNLIVNIEPKVFCFFPTAETFGLKCVVHAPFLLVDSRQQLKDVNLNKELKKLLAKLAAQALVLLRDYSAKDKTLLINENIFELIPEKEYSSRFSYYDDAYYGYDSDSNIFRREYIKVISDHKLLISRQDTYISSNEAVICRPMSMMSILTDKQITNLFNSKFDGNYEEEAFQIHDRHFLRDATQRAYTQENVESILDELGVDVYTGEDLAKDLTPDFMEEYGMKWAKRLYTHLRNEQISLWKRAENSKRDISDTPFCTSPIVLTSDGTWDAAYQSSGVLKLYEPLAGAVGGYSYISDEYSNDKDSMRFLHDLGIKQPDAWDYIESILLPKYMGHQKLYLDEITKDFEAIYNYLNSLTNANDISQKIESLKKYYRLVGLDKCLHGCDDLYLSTDSLKSYFGADHKSKLINNKFYQKFIDKYSIQKFYWLLNLLDVSDKPRIISRGSSYLSYSQLKELGAKNYTWASYTDKTIDGFDTWSPSCIEESKQFWLWLTEAIKDSSNFRASCKYQYYQVYFGEIETSLSKSLKEERWMFSADGKTHKPSEISLEQLNEAGYNIDYNLIQFFGIEKKTKSLSELGASKSQIEQNERGKLAQKYGFDTEEDFKEAYEALKEKRAKKNNKSKTSEDNNANGSNSAGDFINENKSKLRKTSLDDMSSSTKEYKTETPHVEKSQDERVNDITQKLADEANKRIEEETKRASVDDIQIYTQKWFSTLLDLEYKSSMDDSGYNRGQIKISFDRFRKEAGSTHIYVLSNPSRNIPVWLEEIGGLNVKFKFLNRDDVTISFDVANVKDFTLRVKAKSSDVSILDKIDWAKCTKAAVEVNNPVEIMNKLKIAFAALGYKEDFDFKNNLGNNISFIFGPPGTGKTTRLSEVISAKMSLDNCKILVLAPTNKACDVLTRKLIERNLDSTSWLGRFVATGDEFIESSGVLLDRDSSLWTQDKCCVISTIARLPYDGFSSTYEQGALLKDITWDYVIVDEASMIPLVEIVFAIYKLNSSQFIIAGDPHQIEPIVREKAWVGENIYSMVQLDNFEHPKTSPIQFQVEKLDIQYRSVPSIGSLYSNYSYNGKLTHHRAEKSAKNITFGKLDVKPITFIPFRVERFDSIFGAKKLNGSNVHIYSAIFAVETCAYIAKQQTDEIKIGVICPYAPQAQLINKMIEQRIDLPLNVEITCGTIHGFQGDQCDIIITVLNPPTGIRVAADRIMLNKKNILNVAISRASDYLIVLLPHPDSYGYENLIEINKLCGIAKQIKKYTTVINSDSVENKIFGSKSFLELNTFVTTHQLANVYSKTSNLYEVRIDDNAIDIQVGGEAYAISSEDKTVFTESNDLSDNSRTEDLSKTVESNDCQSDPEIADIVNSFTDNHDVLDILEKLVKNGTHASLYVAIQILGNEDFRNLHNLEKISKAQLKTVLKELPTNKLNTTISCWLHYAREKEYCPFHKRTSQPIADLSFSEFKAILDEYNATKKKAANVKGIIPTSKHPKRKRIKAADINGISSNHYNFTSSAPSQSSGNGKLYERFEYGLSDW